MPYFDWFYVIAIVLLAMMFIYVLLRWLKVSDINRELLEIVNSERALNEYLNDKLYELTDAALYQEIVKDSFKVSEQMKVDATFEEIIKDYR